MRYTDHTKRYVHKKWDLRLPEARCDLCIPKKPAPTRPTDIRPLTLLNADLKILALLVPTRLKLRINIILHPHQFCGAHDNIYGAITALRVTRAF
jgi:hypothetical protein